MPLGPVRAVGARPGFWHAAPARRGAGAGGPGEPTFRKFLDKAKDESLAAQAEAPVLAPGDVPFANVPQGQAGLRWAAEELEARLWAFVLQDAFDGENGGLFGASFAGQVYSDWFTQAMATLLVRSGAGQLADQLVEEFSGLAEGVSRPKGNSGGARRVAAGQVTG